MFSPNDREDLRLGLAVAFSALCLSALYVILFLGALYMKRIVFIATLAAASAGMVGCATLTGKLVQDLTPDQKAAILTTFINRCGGYVNAGATGGTGQMGGGFTADFRIQGSCPVPGADGQPLFVAPLKEADKALPATTARAVTP